MSMRVVNAVGGTIDYRLNILGIRVWKDSCQLVARSGKDWSALGPRWDLPVRVPENDGELKASASDTLRLTAFQYNAERPGSDLVEVLNQSRNFEAALQDGTTAVAAAE